MALVTLSYIFTVGTTIVSSQVNLDFSTLYNDYNGNITDANISSSAGIEYTKLALNNTIKNSDILSTTVFNIGNIPVLTYSNITQFPYVKISNTQNSGVGPGSITTGSWQTMPFNTTDNDTSSISSLATNQITLPSGTYLFRSICPFTSTNTSSSVFQTRLYNTTASAILINGDIVYLSTVGSGKSNILGTFTLASSSVLVIQYQAGGTAAGLGVPGSYGTEVYSMAEFTKVA